MEKDTWLAIHLVEELNVILGEASALTQHRQVFGRINPRNHRRLRVVDGGCERGIMHNATIIVFNTVPIKKRRIFVDSGNKKLRCEFRRVFNREIIVKLWIYVRPLDVEEGVAITAQMFMIYAQRVHTFVDGDADGL